jgi:hypothetical protein
MKRVKSWILRQLLKAIDSLLDVRMDNPVIVVFLGEGIVEIQESSSNSQKIQL